MDRIEHLVLKKWIKEHERRETIRAQIKNQNLESQEIDKNWSENDRGLGEKLSLSKNFSKNGQRDLHIHSEQDETSHQTRDFYTFEEKRQLPVPDGLSTTQSSGLVSNADRKTLKMQNISKVTKSSHPDQSESNVDEEKQPGKNTPCTSKCPLSAEAGSNIQGRRYNKKIREEIQRFTSISDLSQQRGFETTIFRSVVNTHDLPKIYKKTCILYNLVLECLFSVKNFDTFINFYEKRIEECRKLKQLHENKKSAQKADFNETYEFLKKFCEFDLVKSKDFQQENLSCLIEKTIQILHEKSQSINKKYTTPFIFSSSCTGFIPLNPEKQKNYYDEKYLQNHKIYIQPIETTILQDNCYSKNEKAKKKKQRQHDPSGLLYEFGSAVIVRFNDMKQNLEQTFLNIQNLEKGIQHPNLGSLQIKSAILFDNEQSIQKHYILKKELDGKWYISNRYDTKEFKNSHWDKNKCTKALFIFLKIKRNKK